jgi:hypothetical protein
MTILAAITAALEGFAAAAKAFPLWLAWKVTGDCEELTNKIIEYEKKGTPSDRAAADRLRIGLTYRRRLHAALLAGHTGNLSGNNDPDETGALQGSN